MPSKLRSTLACTISLLAGVAHAQTTIHVPADQPTIQAGIDAATIGATVLVAPGTYYENIDFKGKYITVTSSGGAAVTILDGSKGHAPAVTITPGTAVVNYPPPIIFNGFTVQNGGSESSLNPTGGIYINLLNPTISSNVITHNYCAGVWVLALASPPTIQNNEIDNTLDTPGGCPPGGGSAIVISRTATGKVGSTAYPAIITNNTLQNNTQGGNEGVGSGGISILQGAVGAQIQGNTIRENTTAASGGALYIASSNTVVAQNLIYANRAACGGGAITTNRTSPYPDGGTLTIASNTIASNTIANNTSGTSCPSTTFGNASQILFGDDSLPTYTALILNNIVSGSSTQPLIACALLKDAASKLHDTPVLDHNLFFNSTGPTADATCTDPNVLSGNFNADPQFLNPAAFNFKLPLSSPAIDAGNNSALAYENPSLFYAVDVTNDFAGNPRLSDATGKGYSILDIGAYELAATKSPNATTLSLSASIGSLGNLGTATGGSITNLTALIASPVGGPIGCLGPVSFLEDGVSIGTVDIVSYLAKASLNNVFLAPGAHHFTAIYKGQSPCGPSVSVSLIFLISNYNPGLTLTSSLNPATVGQSVTFTTTIVSADPKQPGPIYLTDNNGATPLATLTPDATGAATLTTSALALGTHNLTAAYLADTTHNSSSVGLIQYIVTGNIPTTAILTAAPTTALFGSPITLTVTVTPVTKPGPATPTGTVTFLNGATTLGSAPLFSSAVATLVSSVLPVGTDNLTCTYSGDAVYAASPCNIVPVTIIAPATTTTTTLTASPNPAYLTQPVTLTTTTTSATTPSPTGLITFYDASTSLGTATLNASGQATITTTTLAVGTHPLTAVYTPTAPFAGSSSPVVNEVILASGFTLALSPTAITLAPGQQGTVAILLTSVGNFSGPPALTYGPLPTYATASISPSTVTLTAGGTGNSTLTLNTLLKAAKEPPASPPRPGLRGLPTILAASLLLVLPFAAGRRRKPLARLLTILAAAALLQPLTGCVNAYYIDNVVASGTYQVTVTATDVNHNTQSATVTVTVTP